jgi:1-acyl-sn-glycerol-3-phosphate acyltransferase
MGQGDGIESSGERWRRRALTLPAYVLASSVLLAAFPLLLAAALAYDLLTDRRAPVTRCLGFALVYLGCETLGLLASACLWMARRDLAAHYRLQNAWAGMLFWGVRRLFGLRLELEGDAARRPGPLLVFMRHVSVADTLLPAAVLSARFGWRLRYVLKRELLWDPCLDVVGQRLPNVFVRRDTADSAREVQAVLALAADLGADAGVLIYPEGTRFTPAKYARRLAQLEAKGDTERLARARRLRHVLPPRSGGAVALLGGAPGADVLLIGHVGFEHVTTFADAMRGSLIGRVVRVRCWRHPAASVPRDPAGALRWLDDGWAALDAWIDAQGAVGAPRG